MTRRTSLREKGLLNERREGKSGRRKFIGIALFFTVLLMGLTPVVVALVENNSTDPRSISGEEAVMEALESEEITEILEEDQVLVVDDDPIPAMEDEDLEPFSEEPPRVITDGVPSSLPASESVFEYAYFTDYGLPLGTGSGFLGTPDSEIVLMGEKGPSNKSHGGKLGNAPEALYRVLEKFLAKGKAPPPNFPVPYTIYTLSDGGIEKITDVLTKQPTMIDVDNSSDTGQGKKDIRVKTTIEVDPLTITTTVLRLGNTHPTYLRVLVTFPAFFYNGEAGDPDGEPYWMFGYATEPGSEIPEDITMTFTVNRTIGSRHIFDFDWESESGIDSLMFTMGIFQVKDKDTSTPIFPAFSDFIVSSPPSASLTFDTDETDTTSLKCMNWTAPAAFNLNFGFTEAESIAGNNVSFDMDVTVDSIPQSFSVCTVEDRAANTYTVDYTASANVATLNVTTDILVNDVPTVTINLLILNMPAQFQAVLGDGYLNVNVQNNVGFVGINGTATIGMAAIPIFANISLLIWDLPDFNATWFQNSTGNGFALDAPSCIGQIEMAFSLGSLLFPQEHFTDPDSHYLFAHSNTTLTSISLRLIGLSHIGFVQYNSNAFTGIDASFCDNHVLYVFANTTVGSILTPDDNVYLDLEIDQSPTNITLNWTVPFTLNLTTNDPIDSIDAFLKYNNLTAQAEILNIPANMSWHIDPNGSITFAADDSIGFVWVWVHEPTGLPGAKDFFAGDPIRLMNIVSHDIPSFNASWSSEDTTPWTSVAFNTEPLTAIGDLDFAITTSNSTWVVLLGPERNKAMFYNNDTLDLGNGYVMEASLWLHVEDTNRAEFGFGGSVQTIVIGFGATVPHALHVGLELGNKSKLNPNKDNVTAEVVTTALPTSMDLTIIPENSFTYAATAEISLVTVDATIGTTIIHIEVEGIPASADGAWGLTNPGFSELNLGDRLDRIWAVMDDKTGLFSGDLIHVDLLILDVPESVNATWNMNNQSVVLRFLDNSYTEGLGEFRLLATSGEQTPTEDYINGLGTVLPCMTEYTDFTRNIDEGYWPWTVPSRLDALYCRHPNLDTGADDYAVYRTGNDTVNDFEVYAIRVRELGLLNIKLNKDAGFVILEFSRNVALARQFLFISDDFDDYETIRAEVSALPDGLPSNSLRAQWDQDAGHYEYTLTEQIPYIDVYLGNMSSQSLVSEYNKLVLKDIPAQVTFDYEFEKRDGFAYFRASSPWEAGLLIQDGEKRYVGWLQMQSLFFNYSYALPGEESCSHGYKWEWCYRIIRVETDLVAAPVSADGVLGIYYIEDDLDPLITPAVINPGSWEYIPEWTFIIDNFEIMEVDVLWDVYIGVTPLDPYDKVDFDFGAGLFPTVNIQLGVNIAIDYFWNDQIKITLVPGIYLPLFPPPFGGEWTVKLVVNEVKDYRDQKPLHVFPLGSSPVTVNTNGSKWEFKVIWIIEIKVNLNVPGNHRFPDHPTPFT